MGTRIMDKVRIMSDKVYIVVGVGGNYDEAQNWNVCCFRSEERAKEIVDKLNRLVEFNNSFSEKINTEFEIQYNTLHSLTRRGATTEIRPEQPRPSAEFAAIQLACANGNGSPEEKLRFKQLQMKHTARKDAWRIIDKLYSDHLNKLAADKVEAKKLWCDKNYNLPIELLEVKQYHTEDVGGYFSDAFYSFEPMDVSS